MAISSNILDDPLARREQAAATEKDSPEELVLVVEAVEEHLRRKRLQDLYARVNGGHR
jgi:hypothetical protein